MRPRPSFKIFRTKVPFARTRPCRPSVHPGPWSHEPLLPPPRHVRPQRTSDAGPRDVVGSGRLAGRDWTHALVVAAGSAVGGLAGGRADSGGSATPPPTERPDAAGLPGDSGHGGARLDPSRLATGRERLTG